MGVNVVESKIVASGGLLGYAFVYKAERYGCAIMIISSRGMTGMKRILLAAPLSIFRKMPIVM